MSLQQMYRVGSPQGGTSNQILIEDCLDFKIGLDIWAKDFTQKMTLLQKGGNLVVIKVVSVFLFPGLFYN